jgi:hypothetical protein
MVLGQIDMSRWKNINICSQGPYMDVQSAQGPVNKILCTGEILTGRHACVYRVHYITI